MKLVSKIFAVASILLSLFYIGCNDPSESYRPSIKVLNVTDIRVEGNLEKTEYLSDEKFDSTGIKVFAIYDDESEEEITNYSNDFNQQVSNKSGLNIPVEITISYGKYSKTIKHTVNRSNYKFTDTPKLSSNQTGFYKGSETHPAVYYDFGDYPQSKASNQNIVLSEKESSRSFLIGEDGNLYVKKDKTVYVVEPIKWRVLNSCTTDSNNYQNTKKAILQTDSIIEGGIPFYVNNSISANKPYERRYPITGVQIYPNVYEYSTVRAFLNGLDASSYTYKDDKTDSSIYNYQNKGFLQIAFSKSAQNKILVTKVDNSKEQSVDTDGNMSTPSTNKKFNNTKDKIYLLSVKESTNSNYGFNSNGTKTDSSKIHKPTDYAGTNSMGKNWSGYAHMMLRSVHDSKTEVRYCYNDGKPNNYKQCNDGDMGLVPVLCVEIQ